MLYFDLDDRWVRYKDSIFGSVGIGLNPFFIQNEEKSLKSALYALNVFAALEFFKFLIVSNSKVFKSVIN